MKRHYIAVLGLLGIGCATQAAADVIGLSTGTATYTITSDSNGGVDADYTGPAITVTSLAAGWLANPITDGIGDSGVWVAPYAHQAGVSDSVGGTTVYQATFSLAGLDPTSAVLTMNLTADDYVDVTLNGTTIFTHTSTEMWTAAAGIFTVTNPADFLAGTNTLVFTVPNNDSDGAASCCGPTGLDVAASVSASEIATPEPHTVLPLAGAVLFAAFILRKRFRLSA